MTGSCYVNLQLDDMFTAKVHCTVETTYMKNVIPVSAV